MNVGQIFENLLGSAGRWNGEEYRVGAFDEMFAEEASRGTGVGHPGSFAWRCWWLQHYQAAHDRELVIAMLQKGLVCRCSNENF